MFQSIPSETKLVVKLGRALLPGEYKIKVYLLRMNDPEVGVTMVTLLLKWLKKLFCKTVLCVYVGHRRVKRNIH